MTLPCSLPALRGRGTDHSADQRGIMLWEWQPLTSPGRGQLCEDPVTSHWHQRELKMGSISSSALLKG